jgi:hypothetical protein
MKNTSVIRLLLLSVCFVYACNSNENKPLNQYNPEDSTTEFLPDSDMATYFVLIVDTGNKYSMLDNRMYHLSRNKKLTVDTMGRYYNSSKNLIALPDNDEDELYAGDYYPRRFPSTFLSIEYLDFYTKEAGSKTLALVAGIYEKRDEADSVLTVLGGAEKNAFCMESQIYIGCMH